MDFADMISQQVGLLLNTSRSALMDMLNQFPDLSSLIQPYVTEPKEYPYGRNIIFKSNDIEIIVIHLPANSHTFIHDHGKSECCGRVIQGEIVNVEYEANEHDQVRISKEHHVHAGEIFSTPLGVIHQMQNRQAERVISLHAYSPPIIGLKIYAQPELLNIK
jgi:cysteine dioxygenase